MNSVNLTGRLVRDPELRYTQSQMAICSFTLAVDRQRKKDDPNAQPADFPRCIAFGKTAENMHKFLHKGSKVGVEGRIQTGSYKKQDGTTVYTTDVIANHVEFLDSKQQSTSQGSFPAYGAPTQSAPKTQQTSVDIGDGGAPVEGFAMIDENDIPF